MNECKTTVKELCERIANIPFVIFVKNNYKQISERTPNASEGEIMTELIRIWFEITPH